MIKLLDGQTLEKQAVSTLRPRSVEIAGQGDVLLQRAVHLQREDRLIVELSLRGQLSQRRLAELVGKPHGTIARRLKRLTTLLRDPLIVGLLEGPCPLERADREIAIGYFLHRRSLRDLATTHGVSAPRISRTLHFVRGWFRGATLRALAEHRLRRGG